VPPTPESHADPRQWPWLSLLAVLPVLAALLWLGNDGSWDMRNYHLYNPHAWLHGRYAIDVAPAQQQSFHNPLLDLPFYLLGMAGFPAKAIGAWLALPVMLSIACLLRLQARLSPRAPSRGEQVFLSLLALTGAATWSTLGLSMDDAFVGGGVLAALTVLLDRDAPPSPSACLIAGAIAGATIGLKLSAAFYAPALAIAVACVPGTARERVARVALLGVGGSLGGALTYGWWAWRLWQEHGNPFFPYFNQLFHSPDVAAVDWVDKRFRPASVIDLLLAPVRLTWKTHLFSELRLRDPRLLLGILGLAWLAWRARGDNPLQRARAWLLAAFVVAAWWGWGRQSGIYRYAIVLELLGALAVSLLIAQRPRAGMALLLGVFVLVTADTTRPDWGRIASTRSPAPSIAGGEALPAGALVVSASGVPSGYLALALPDSVPMIGLSNNLFDPEGSSRLQREALRRLRTHRGPVYLVTTEPGDGAQQCLTDLEGFVAAGACLRIDTTVEAARLCPQQRSAALPGRVRPARCKR
jgi:hypothetical protein